MEANTNELHRWDLFKSYGEFNLMFESMVSEVRNLLVSLIRISYNYFEEEDEEENELPEIKQDRLLKILLSNMSAAETIQNCRACFVDFFSRQKEIHGNYSFRVYGDPRILSEGDFKLSTGVLKKCLELVELRNIIIHSHYEQSMLSFGEGNELDGFKHSKTSKGYEVRNYKFHASYFEKINRHIEELYYYLVKIKHCLYLTEGDDFIQVFSQLNEMDFEPPLVKS